MSDATVAAEYGCTIYELRKHRKAGTNTASVAGRGKTRPTTRWAAGRIANAAAGAAPALRNIARRR